MNAVIEFAQDLVYTGVSTQKAFRVRAEMGKAFAGLHDRIAGEFEKLAEARARGGLKMHEFVTEFSDHLESVATDVYRMGKRTATGNENTYVNSADRVIIAKFIERQQIFIRRFGAELGNDRYDPETEAGLIRLRWRSGMYADRLEGLASRAFKSAAPNQIAKWILGEAEHCDDCIEESEKPARPLKDFAKLPGEGETECLTNCKCYLEIQTKGARKNIAATVNP
jgi:hypothetical protein